MVGACIAIGDGKIAAIDPYDSEASDVIDVGDSVIMPGLVDSHVHLNEPGRTDWEGFEFGTRAAAAGGITTLIDMPLNSIPATTNSSSLELKRRAAVGKSYIDYGFWGGVIPNNFSELEGLVDAGVMGFKAFLIESGVSEFPMVTSATLEKAMPIIAKTGLPLLVHAELRGEVRPAAISRNYQSYLDSRPQSWEIAAVKLVSNLARETGCRVHIVHLSASDALAYIEQAKEEGLGITSETCPHYLSISSEEIEMGATHFKCAPPIREGINREKLWEGLERGVIDFIVSDHSPCTPALKRLDSGHFGEAWGGIAGLQLSLAVVWTEMKNRGFPISKLVRWMCYNPARFLGIEKIKGEIKLGMDADIVVWNPQNSFIVSREIIRHRHTLTPYEGKRLFGVVEKTFVRGVCIYDGGNYSRPIGLEIVRKNGFSKHH